MGVSYRWKRACIQCIRSGDIIKHFVVTKSATFPDLSASLRHQILTQDCSSSPQTNSKFLTTVQRSKLRVFFDLDVGHMLGVVQIKTLSYQLARNVSVRVVGPRRRECTSSKESPMNDTGRYNQLSSVLSMRARKQAGSLAKLGKGLACPRQIGSLKHSKISLIWALAAGKFSRSFRYVPAKLDAVPQSSHAKCSLLLHWTAPTDPHSNWLPRSHRSPSLLDKCLCSSRALS